MIGRLTGKLLERQPPWLLIGLSNGISYEVQVPLSAFCHLPPGEGEITLFTHLQVREDAMSLYGFLHARERTLFKHLIKVSGVGPKLALAVLSSMDVDAFIHCINDNNVTALTRLPGVGKKTAERLIIDMRDRLQDWSHSRSSTPAVLHADAEHDALQALQSLGYKPAEAKRLLGNIDSQGKSVEDIIRLVLQGVPA